MNNKQPKKWRETVEQIRYFKKIKFFKIFGILIPLTMSFFEGVI